MLSDRPERLAAGSVLWTDDGPLVVVAARPHQDRWIAGFEGIHDRDGADALRSTVLWGEPIEDEAELWVHELIGCRVIDSGGVDRGVVESVQANPAADLLVLEGGGLVPVSFVVGRPRDGRIVVDGPEGLFDL